MIDDVFKILSRYREEAKFQSSATNYSMVRTQVQLRELAHEVHALDIAIEESGRCEKAFKKSVRMRLNKRQISNALYIPLSQEVQTPVHQMYAELIEILFNPKNLKEFLEVLAPDVREFISVVVSDDTDSIPKKYDSPAKVREYLKSLREFQDNWPLDITVTSLDVLKDKPATLECLSHFVIEGNRILNVGMLLDLPLGSLALLEEKLRQEYPGVHNQLFRHNASFDGLAYDIKLFQNNRITPRTAVQRLIRVLILGGQRMTDQGYVDSVVENAFKQFLNYLSALPSLVKKGLEELGSYDKTLKMVMENLNKGHCVETEATSLNEILKSNKPPHSLLDSPPEISSRAVLDLKRKYRPSRQTEKKFLDSEQNTSAFYRLPSRIMRRVLAVIQPVTFSDLMDLLLNFPPDFYVELWASITLNNPEDMLIHLADIIRGGLPSQEQLAYLTKAIAQNYEKFALEISLLHWAVTTAHISFINEVLKTLSENKRFENLTEITDEGYTLLHNSVDDPELFKTLIQSLPTKRLDALKAVNDWGDAVIHNAADNPASLKIIFDCLTEPQALIFL